MSDCSAEVPSENENDEDSHDTGAVDYKPQKYSEKYHKGSRLLQREEKKK